MRFRRVGTVLLGLAATTGLMSGTSAEATPLQDCAAINVPIGLSFCLFYNSDYGGDMVSTGYNVSNFAGWTWDNGQSVKNNAASAYNYTERCGRLYFNSNYAGASDTIAAGTGWRRLVNTYNNNASFRWCS
ncbi:peptidase inhibitor family I36 protein [Streptomyces sp. NPDC096205]|uniref:peptidase inhibitor family I36 protein n=1 Tax=Streptomyces sp. NPDC096205 TaxID=3366081 RepID=UPI0038307969